ncbi:MAG: TonB-dependent receptor [Chitinophagaceae bacterium]
MLSPTIFRCLLISFLLLSFGGTTLAQNKTATVKGIVLNENDLPLSGASISMLGKNGGLHSNDSGRFEWTVPANKAFALVFSYTGYKPLQKNFILNTGEVETVTIKLERETNTLKEVVVTNNTDRYQPGLVSINPKNALILPSTTGGIESLIKILVGSNNELTSQYSVRGGNYDENLIYINDFEVYRPYLVRSGQQEGLSFINPELTRSVQFYNGGFQAKYGDKISSVLDIKYKQPSRSGGSAYISLLEQGLHLEGASRNGKLSWLAGARNRSNRNLLASQETQGNYVPSSSDVQAFLTYRPNNRWELSATGIRSGTKFSLEPTFSQQSTAVFSPFYTANIALDIYFEGKEKDRYATNMIGVSAERIVNEKLRLKWMASYFQNKEEESIDISGAYLFGEREFDKSKPEFGSITNPLGAGLYQQFARNRLNLQNLHLSHKGALDAGKHFIQWGLGLEQYNINDKLNEWELQDSAGYSLPYQPGALTLNKAIRSNADLDFIRLTGHLQDNLLPSDSGKFTLQAGLRFNYNALNKELLLSPRLQGTFRPEWKKDIIFRAALGAYHQPPFYRELRRPDGSVNRDLLAQKSWQISAGMDYQFTWNDRPFRLTTEAWYKNLYDVVTYDQENVKIRYAGENNAKAYAAGFETRLFGEIVKDAESWVSLGFMRTRENLENDTYYNYTLDEQNNPTDSTLVNGGWFRRPTDRFITFGLFFQDYLSTNKNFKVHINAIYGSNMPFNLPNSVKYRNALIIEPYIRMDMGFSALLLDTDASNRRSKSPFRNFKNIWLSLEVFNLIDRANTISYQMVKDFSNNVFSIPNRLTPRLLNIKLVGRW